VFRRGFVEEIHARFERPDQVEAAAGLVPLRRCALLLLPEADASELAAAVVRHRVREIDVWLAEPGSDEEGYVRRHLLALVRALEAGLEGLSIEVGLEPDDARSLVGLLARLRLCSLGLYLTGGDVSQLADGGVFDTVVRLALASADTGVQGLRKVLARVPHEPLSLKLSTNAKLMDQLHLVFDRRLRALDASALPTDALFDRLTASDHRDLRHLTLCFALADRSARLAEAPLAGLTRLQLFRNHREPMDADALRTLCGAPWLGQLVALKLAGFPAGDAGLQALLEAPGLERLTALALGGGGIGDRGAELLAGWPGLAHVTALDLRGNPIGAAGLQALIRSPHLDPAQIELDLSRAPELEGALRERFGAALLRR
jgi:hypothetical protein